MRKCFVCVSHHDTEKSNLVGHSRVLVRLAAARASLAMLVSLTVFTRGGVVVWSSDTDEAVQRPINTLISDFLLEERKNKQEVAVDKYNLNWQVSNDLGLYFVAVYERALTLTFVDALLERVRESFAALYVPDSAKLAVVPFDDQYSRIAREVQAEATAQQNTAREMRPWNWKELEKSGKTPEPKASKKDDEKPAVKPVEEPAEEGESEGAEESLSALRGRGRGRGGRPGPRGGRGGRTPTATPSPKAKGGKKTEGKKLRKWDESSATKEELDALDVTKAKPGEISQAMRDSLFGTPKADSSAKAEEESDSDEEDEDDTEETDESVASPAKKKAGVFGFLKQLTNRTLSQADVEAVLAPFRQHLVAKNVASDIADQLCGSVCTSLVGTTQSTFGSIRTTVRNAIEAALTRILTPRRNVDILRDVLALRETSPRRPYSIVFVGVNGVGKSTNLAKVCYWLQQHKLKVMIAACDTFRSAAVEQLRVHASCLDVHLFERGYGKDAAQVANEALRYGKENGYDVVLIDTAGRMENNEPLMRALVKLITVNRPDLILFVGEALVGNKAVEQLSKFNQAMIDLCDDEKAGAPRTIDGILLTKFDTIDDKVGAALSMVYTTGQPIVFMGTGQHYHSLQTFSVKRIVEPLLATK